MESLASHISAIIKQENVPMKVGEAIHGNLNPKYKLRPYQLEALVRFRLVMDGKVGRQRNHFLFQMATGSGKTLVMAAIVLDLYRRGYRHFIFFVNRSNIIEKTRDNFLNDTASKFLFSEDIVMGNNPVNIVEVDNFESCNSQDVNIVFTTIQGLHTQLNTPKENTLTYEDFNHRKIALLSDEAHHINADTKKSKRTKSHIDSALSWEATVRNVFQVHAENILLEFTATADLSHPAIRRKYNDKLLFDYSLRAFREDGFAKEVKVLQADMAPFDRALLAVVISQYRRKIFEKYGQVIKPVILMKSKTIKESKDFFTEFTNRMARLTLADFNLLIGNSSNVMVQKVFSYFENNGILMDNLIKEIQEDFSLAKCITVDSSNDSIEKQLVLNSLEDSHNEYRVVFAVDKLNEGWDVLNLFDIVRLYDTKATSVSKKLANTAMSEVQLIGRGARYCPFVTEERQALYKRKYDDNPNHEMRIGEELYYHAAHNPRFIAELNKSLVDIGLIDKEVDKIRKRPVMAKSKSKAKSNHRKNKLGENITHRYRLHSGNTSLADMAAPTTVEKQDYHERAYDMLDFGMPILRKATSKIPFYRFDNIQRFFPNVISMEDLLSAEAYLGSIKLIIEGSPVQLKNISANTKLNAAIEVYKHIARHLQEAD